jgi:hypothetical protein
MPSATQVTARIRLAQRSLAPRRDPEALAKARHSDRTGFNEKGADLIAKFVGPMWMFYALRQRGLVIVASTRDGTPDPAENQQD